MWGMRENVYTKDEAKPSDLLNKAESDVVDRNGDRADRGQFGWKDEEWT